MQQALHHWKQLLNQWFSNPTADPRAHFGDMKFPCVFQFAVPLNFQQKSQERQQQTTSEIQGCIHSISSCGQCDEDDGLP